MNSGKYLYKIQPSTPNVNSVSHSVIDKKNVMLCKKRKLKYFDDSFIDILKSFIVKLNKREEERKTLKKKKKIEANNQQYNIYLNNNLNDEKNKQKSEENYGNSHQNLNNTSGGYNQDHQSKFN